MLEFDTPETVSVADIYLYDDGRGVRTPRGYRVEARTPGGWAGVEEVSRRPALPMGSALNRVRFKPVRTTALRFVFDHPLPEWAGASEIRLWPDTTTN